MTPYWLDGASPLAGALTGDVSTDVLVIGAGLCGASAALALGHARDGATGRITSVAATRRTPAPGTGGYERLQSEALGDWYSASPSAHFAKEAAEAEVTEVEVRVRTRTVPAPGAQQSSQWTARAPLIVRVPCD